jgi:hypothetical protein
MTSFPPACVQTFSGAHPATIHNGSSTSKAITPDSAVGRRPYTPHQGGANPTPVITGTTAPLSELAPLVFLLQNPMMIQYKIQFGRIYYNHSPPSSAEVKNE